MKILITILIIISSLTLKSREIKVIDDICLFPIVSAKIYIIDSNNKLQKGYLTNEKGIFNIDTNKELLVKISAIGYETKEVLISEKINIFRLAQKEYLSEKVVVTGNIIPDSRDNSIYDLKVISAKELKYTAPANLRESLNNNPNINITNRSGFGSSITLNGLSGSNIKILKDGVPVVGRLNGNIDLNHLNLNDIKQIEIIDGPMSSLYGSNAFGGVINLISETSHKSGFSGNINSKNNSLGQFFLNAALTNRSELGTMKFSLGRNYLSGFSNDENSRLQTWKPREQYQAGLSFKKHNNNLNYLANINYFTEKMTSRGELLAPYFVTAFDIYTHTKRFASSFKINGFLSDDYYFNSLVSYSYYQRNREKYFKDMTTLNEYLVENNDNVELNDIFGRIFIEHSFSNKTKIQFGIDNTFQNINSDRIISNENNDNNLSTFLISNFQFSNLKIAPAFRLNYNDNYGVKFTPTFNSKYKYKDFDFSLTIASGYRTPDLKEKYLEFNFSETINILGNTNLKPETAQHFKFKTQYKIETKKMNNITSLSVYYNHLNNLINTVQISDTHWQYHNLEQQTTTGVNLSHSLYYDDFSINTYFNYNGINNYFENEKISFSPNLDIKTGYNLDFLNSNISLSYKYTGKINSYYINNNNIIERSFINDYQNLDLTMYFELIEQSLHLNLGIRNILDDTDADINGKVRGYSSSKDANKIDINYGCSFFLNLKYEF